MDRHQYIRAFMAPGFAFLLRKLAGEQLRQMICFVCETCVENSSEEYNEGVAMLFFETIKGPQNTFHSKSLSVLSAMLHCAEGSKGKFLKFEDM